MRIVFLILFLASIVACNPEVEPISFGNDDCSFCKMTIVDQRYGAELLTTKGKIFKYDAIECMINAMCDNAHNEAKNLHSAYFIDFSNPGTLININDSKVLYTKNLPSPMGAYLTGFKTNEEALEFLDDYDGKIFAWDGVYLKIVGNRTCQHDF